MDHKAILKKIVDEAGSCDWVDNFDETHGDKAICRTCPMSKLKKHEDGNYMSCTEALNVHEHEEGEANRVYLDQASRLLMDMDIEEILTKEDQCTSQLSTTSTTKTSTSSDSSS
jgi:hypothetical protein